MFVQPKDNQLVEDLHGTLLATDGDFNQRLWDCEVMGCNLYCFGCRLVLQVFDPSQSELAASAYMRLLQLL